MSYLTYILAIPPIMIILLRLIALVLPKRPAQLASFYAFTITAFALLIVCATYGVFASIALRCIGYGGLSQWTVARSFKWSMWLATGVTFDVRGSMRREGGVSGEEGLEMRPVVFVGNHQTELDVLMLGCMFPRYCSVTAKKSLMWTPFLGWFSTFPPTSALCQFQDAEHRTNMLGLQWPSPKPSSSTAQTGPPLAQPSTQPPPP